ncbi:MAG: zinc-binding alcohol dehydrogenase [Anaerolineae bacterium]|nr:zinc-binding alcohol dehydrogenase [Anaerolineae bacterium]
MKAKAILFTRPGHVELGDALIPDPGPGDVLVEAAYSCISPGTELRVLGGSGEGGAIWPLIPGYAMAGRVIACGDGVTLREGAPVFCGGTTRADRHLAWGAHVSHAVQSADYVMPVPEGVDLLEAAVARLASIAYHGLRLSRPQPHERVAVVGLGPIGQLSARLHHLTGAHVVAADRSPERVAIAQAAGVEAIAVESDVSATFAPMFPDGADVIVDATGAPAVLAQCLSLARDIPWDNSLTPGSRLVIQGSYAGDVALPYLPAFMKEITLLVPRDQQRRDLATVLDLIGRGKLQVRDVASQVCTPEQAPHAYDDLRAGKGALLTAAIRWK